MPFAPGAMSWEQNPALFLNASRKQINNPSVLMKVSVDILGCAKFFAKLALATGHYVLGESFSRSAGADTLRRVLSSNPRNGWEHQCLTGIVFVLRSGIPWEMLPQEMGCGSGMSCWRRLRDWEERGIWQLLYFVLLTG